MEQSVILFDGVCNFCNSSVNFIIKHDKAGKIKFAPLQSETGMALLRQYDLLSPSIDSIVFITGGKAYIKSTAALHVAKTLGFPWSLFYVFIIIPAFMRNWIYDIIAKNRYRWFGKKESCMIPTPEVRSRFLN